jgi:hypothetical protein
MNRGGLFKVPQQWVGYILQYTIDQYNFLELGFSTSRRGDPVLLGCRSQQVIMALQGGSGAG